MSKVNTSSLPLSTALVLLLSSIATASGLPVTSAHPRLLLTSVDLARLTEKKNSNDPTWLALKAAADAQASYSIFKYDYCTRSEEPDNTIFYDYEGAGWYSSALPLALAYRMSSDSAYSNQLLALADEMIRAQSNPDPTQSCSAGETPLTPLEVDDYYPSRYLGYTLAVIYDWCYDQLGATRRAQMVALMNAYFDDLRANAYQANGPADGNYFGGHLICAAAMGYASYGDNPRAQEMIDYARMRFDGTPSTLVDPSDVPLTHFDQLFNGGYVPQVALDYNGPTGLRRAPFKGGFDFQGWAYGSGNDERIIDYLLMVRSATGENLTAVHGAWFSAVLRAEKQALLPNHFEIDSTGDWGGNQGAVIPRELPARLAYLLAGTPDGAGAQHFAYSEIAESTFPDATVHPLSEWEDFFFTDLTRPSQALRLHPFVSAFGPAYPQAGATNGAMPYFIMRSGWGPDAIWASLHMGNEWYDDHMHYDAGQFTIFRGNDYLLVDATNWKGPAGSEGIVGDSTEALRSSEKNTLFFDDFGDYMYTDTQYAGGQAGEGVDQVVAAAQNDGYTYVRSDLSKAYDRSPDPADEPNRKLGFFYRSFLYLRPANVFLVYDQVQAKTSTNSMGPYQKHLRWHFPNVPSISGRTVTVDQGDSRLYMDTLLPTNLSLTAVDESNNPDPGPDYEKDSGTWRIEVRDKNNPLFIPFLTVFQPGTPATPKARVSKLSSDDGVMVGAQIIHANGTIDIVFFNNRAGQVPFPLSSAFYRFSAAIDSQHTLMGFQPRVKYSVSHGAGTVLVQNRECGHIRVPPGTSCKNVVASPAGVLQFQFATLVPVLKIPVADKQAASAQVPLSPASNRANLQVDGRGNPGLSAR